MVSAYRHSVPISEGPTYSQMEGLAQQLAEDCEMSDSPTATPFQTRSGSPVHTSNVKHSPGEGDAAIACMWSILKSRRSSQVIVSSVDGSATVPATTKFKHLAVYFAFNLGLTLFNKAVMIQVSSCSRLFSPETSCLVSIVAILYPLPFPTTLCGTIHSLQCCG